MGINNKFIAIHHVTYYELTNHLGNVLSVITPDASDVTQPVIVSLTDYYPFGMEEPGRSYNSNTSRFGYTGHEKENDLAEGVYTTQYRLLDTRLGRWMSVDPLFAKYPDMSAYNYCGGNPVVMVDPDGRDVILMIWATYNGNIGHAGLAISKYKEEYKNGTKEYVQDGDKFIYRDLWPAEGVGKGNFDNDVQAIYQEFTMTRYYLINFDPSNREGGSIPDGIIQFTTDYETDKKIIENLDNYIKKNKNYNGLTNNCSDYVECALETMIGVELNVDEQLSEHTYATTPNKVYKAAEKINGATVLQDPKEKVSEGFLKSCAGEFLGKIGKFILEWKE